MEREVVNNFKLWIITKGDVSELHLTFNGGEGGGDLCLRLFRHIEEFKDPLSCCHGGLEHVGHLCHLGNWLGEVASVLDKGLDITHRDGPFDGQHPPQEGNSDISQISNGVHDGHH